MSFWDKEVRNSFDRMFDFNRDGKLDLMEQELQFEFMEEEIQRDELESAGLDPDELADMDESERREAIDMAGLDPDDFDEF